MRWHLLVLVLLGLLSVGSAAVAAPPGNPSSAPMPPLLYAGPDAPLPIWVDASEVLDDAGKVKAELFGYVTADLQDLLDRPTEDCLPFQDVHTDYAQPPVRGSLDDAVEHSRTRLLAVVTNKSYGVYSGFIPGQLLQVTPIREFGKPLEDRHYYVFIPVGDFLLGDHPICKEDPSYAQPPEVGSEVFLFIAGPPEGRDDDLLMVYGPGDVVPVARDGSLLLPPHYSRRSGLSEKSGGPRSRAELLDLLARRFPHRVSP